MAPQPVEDMSFPALSDEILELLRTLWTFVSDFCLALWSYVPEALCAVWTSLIALDEYVVAHPLASLAIVALLFVIVPWVLNALNVYFLYCLGFRRRGVLRGSYAANYQSTIFGGNVAEGSMFARFQSQGARGDTGYPSWDW